MGPGTPILIKILCSLFVRFKLCLRVQILGKGKQEVSAGLHWTGLAAAQPAGCTAARGDDIVQICQNRFVSVARNIDTRNSQFVIKILDGG